MAKCNNTTTAAATCVGFQIVVAVMSLMGVFFGTTCYLNEEDSECGPYGLIIALTSFGVLVSQCACALILMAALYIAPEEETRYKEPMTPRVVMDIFEVQEKKKKRRQSKGNRNIIDPFILPPLHTPPTPKELNIIGQWINQQPENTSSNVPIVEEVYSYDNQISDAPFSDTQYSRAV